MQGAINGIVDVDYIIEPKYTDEILTFNLASHDERPMVFYTYRDDGSLNCGGNYHVVIANV